MTKRTVTEPFPGPYRAEGLSVKAITHGRELTIARCASPKLNSDGNKATAQFIVRACNSHAALRDALRECADAIDGLRFPRQSALELAHAAGVKARAALAAAEGSP